MRCLRRPWLRPRAGRGPPPRDTPFDTRRLLRRRVTVNARSERPPFPFGRRRALRFYVAEPHHGSTGGAAIRYVARSPAPPSGRQGPYHSDALQRAAATENRARCAAVAALHERFHAADADILCRRKGFVRWSCATRRFHASVFYRMKMFCCNRGRPYTRLQFCSQNHRAK